MIYYFYLLLAVTLIGIQNCLMKVYQSKVSGSVSFSFLFNAGLGLVAGLIFFIVNGFKLSINVFSTAMAFTMACGITLNNVFAIKVISYGKLSIFTLFLMLGGMFCPFIYGVLFLNEHAGVWRWIALAILIFAMIFSEKKENGEEKRSSDRRKFYLFCGFTFLSNGAVSIVSKVHQVSLNNSPTNDFLIVTYLFLLVLNLIIFGFMQLHKKKAPMTGEPKPEKKKWILGCVLMAAYATVSGIAFFIQVDAAIHLPATVLYPMVTGGTVVITALFGRLFFKEAITVSNWMGLLMVVGATCLFLIP